MTKRQKTALCVLAATGLVLLLWSRGSFEEPVPERPRSSERIPTVRPIDEVAQAVDPEASSAEPAAPPSRVVRGRVTDGAGRPVPGARVRLDTASPYDYGIGVGGWERQIVWSETGPDGRFEIAPVEGLTMDGKVVVLARARGFAPGVSKEIGADRPAREVDLVLGAGATLDFIVLDEGTGVPIPGAALHVTPGLYERCFVHFDGDQTERSPGAPTHLPPAAVSDEFGRLVLRDLIAQSYLCIVTATGFDHSTLRPFRAPSVEPVRIELHRRPLGEIRGVVVFPDGAPVEWARIVAPEGDGEKWRGSFSGKDGSFRIAGLPPGVHRLEVAAMGKVGFVPRVFLAVPTDRPDVRLVVDRGLLLRLRMVNPDGRPCPGVEIEVPGFGPRKTDAEGRIEVSGLSSGSCVVAVNLRGYWGVWETLRKEVVPGGDEVTITGPERHALGGVLTNGKGEPLAGVRIRMHGPGDSTRSAVTNSRGEFLVEPLRPGKYRLNVGEGKVVRPATVDSGRRDLRVVAVDARPR